MVVSSVHRVNKHACYYLTNKPCLQFLLVYASLAALAMTCVGRLVKRTQSHKAKQNANVPFFVAVLWVSGWRFGISFVVVLVRTSTTHTYGRHVHSPVLPILNVACATWVRLDTSLIRLKVFYTLRIVQ